MCGRKKKWIFFSGRIRWLLKYYYNKIKNRAEQIIYFKDFKLFEMCKESEADILGGEHNLNDKLL